jgi:hypothetical protein
MSILPLIIILAVAALCFFLALNRRARDFLSKSSMALVFLSKEQREANIAMGIGFLLIFGLLLLAIAIFIAAELITG